MGEPQIDEATGEHPVLALSLRGPEAAQAVGAGLQIEVELRNVADHEVWVVGVLDGSEEGARYPHYRPRVWREGTVVAEPPRPEDPLVGPLRTAHFRRLGPGESFDPTRRDDETGYMPLATFSTYRPPEPGVYRYELRLSTESERPEQWLGRLGQDAERAAVIELVARVPRVTVVSNNLEIEVR